MPDNIADVIRDTFIQYDADLLRLEASERRLVLKDLKKLESKLRSDIQRTIPDDGLTSVTKRRTRALHQATERSIRSSYHRINQSSRKRMAELAETESAVLMQSVNRAATIPLLSVGLSEASIDAMLSDNIVLGQPMREWWNRQAASTITNFRSSMRQGLFAGETVDQLIRRVRGTRAQNFQNGIMAISRRGASTVVRTSMQSIRNEARAKTIKNNESVLSGKQVVVTFDTRTSPICIARSGFAWDHEGKPLNSRTSISFPGPPPWHPNCRSTLIPLTKGYDELVSDPDLSAKIKEGLDKMPPATRASMNGYVAADLTYPQWLRSQPAAIQRKVLGPGRQKLFAEGNLSLRDLVDESGRPLTLAQLRAKRGLAPI